jgi:RHS repeat-associated protein
MSEINFFWDPLSDNILQERDETGAVTAEYTAEPGLYGNIISQNRGGVESQFHYDAQGSTLAVTDDNQNVTDTRAYTAFGETTESTGSTSFPFQYIGQKGYYQDGLTDQYLVRRRPYEPREGRWLGSDPVEPAPPNSLYAYVRNSPTSRLDPSGLSPDCDAAEVIAQYTCDTTDVQEVELPEGLEPKCYPDLCVNLRGLVGYTCIKEESTIFCVLCECNVQVVFRPAASDECCVPKKGMPATAKCVPVPGLAPVNPRPTCGCVAIPKSA